MILANICYGTLGDVTIIPVDGGKAIWHSNSQTFSIAGSGSMSESIDYLWPAADGTGGQALLTDGSGVLSFGVPSTSAAHDILSVTHDAVAQGVTRGSIIYGNATPKWDELIASAVLGGAATDFFGSDGTDVGYRTLAQVLADLSGDAAAAFDWNGQNLTSLGNITGADIDISAGTGDYSSTGTIGSAKHTITSTGTAPLLEVKNTANNLRVLFNRDDAAAMGFNIGAAKVGPVFDSDVGDTYAISSQTLANILAGTGGATEWSMNSSGDVTGTGTLTGHTSITVDSITLNGNVISDSSPGGLHITGAAPILIGDSGTNVAEINHSTGDMRFLGGAGLIFGSFWGNEIAFVTAGGTGAFSIISDADITVGQTNNTTFQNNQELAVGFAGMYLVNYSVTAKGTGANKHLVAAIGVDSGGGDVAQSDGRSHAITLGSAELAISGTAILDLSTNDEVSIMITNETDNTNVTVEHVSLSTVQVGGT